MTILTRTDDDALLVSILVDHVSAHPIALIAGKLHEELSFASALGLAFVSSFSPHLVRFLISSVQVQIEIPIYPCCEGGKRVRRSIH